MKPSGYATWTDFGGRLGGRSSLVKKTYFEAAFIKSWDISPIYWECTFKKILGVALIGVLATGQVNALTQLSQSGVVATIVSAECGGDYCGRTSNLVTDLAFALAFSSSLLAMVGFVRRKNGSRVRPASSH